ncbi:glycosyl hydrolase family 18 protein [Brevibacillus daliensis]|uniref:glycosyl hydrolase family 18 protein n=1 Tax=Brevibacillus daliensis TaxID=2892995 RepID=UPI001E58AAA6|nr:glycosyl hydrolase family 18 protein [Brevibacillus daliensis]
MNGTIEISKRHRRREKRLVPRPFLLILFVLVAGLAWYFLQADFTKQVAPYEGRENVIVFNGKAAKQSYQLKEDEILLPFDFIKEQIDPYVFWDEPTRSIIITTKDKVVRMPTENLTAYVNKKPVDLRVPVTVIDGESYVPATPLEKLYGIKLRTVNEKSVVVVEKEGDTFQEGKLKGNPEDTVRVRVQPSVESPYLADVAAGNAVDVLGETSGWTNVFTSNGLVGYVSSDVVEKTTSRKVETTMEKPKEQNTAWKPEGQLLNVTWEQVVNKSPNLDTIPAMPGLHVVSPTWFELMDDQATIGNKADASYLRWAHSQGYKVWAVVTNGFNPDWTKAMLSDYNMREKMINQLLQYTNMYNVDGINIDFENVYLEDKERLVQFVRELTPYLHEQNVTVSLDVTMMHGSDRWSNFYDRKALAKTVDYIMLMAYDEHWASSPKAGSVASLPWVENGLKEVLTEVPKEKLLLGVPFYTRLWKEVVQPDGTTKVTSRALYMSGAERWMNEKKVKPTYDEATGQNFVTYKDPKENATYKMWLEDETSIQKRIEIAKKYELAGVATWRRGFEEPQYWKFIQEKLNGK